MSALYACMGCHGTQPIVTSAQAVAPTTGGAWVALVVCNDCGTRGHVLVTNDEVGQIDYWHAVDRANRQARQRAYARADGPQVVAEAERILKEAVRE